MAKAKPPYMPLYGKDAWSDEDFLAAEWDTQGLFWRLAWWQWSEGSIPDDLKKILNVIGKPHSTKRLWPHMKHFFIPLPGEDGRLYNEKVDELRREALRLSERRQAGAEVTNQKLGRGTLSDTPSDTLEEDNERPHQRVASRVATAIADASGSRSLEGEREGEPPDPKGLAPAVLRLKPRFAQVGMRTEPSIALLAGWVERFGEELILETLADKDEKLRGKDFRYLETILVNRLDHPEERPRNRMKSDGNSKDFRGKSSGLDAEAERQLRAGENRFHPSQEEIRRDEVIEAARALKRRVQKTPDPTASEYLSWLAPNGDGVVREDALSFAEWQVQKVSV